MTTQEPPKWANYPDEKLLDLRIKDLGLQIKGTRVEKYVTQLYEELQAKNISLRPLVYLGDEWFSPQDVPTIAVPFYLTHSRLIQLEKKQIMEAEGDTSEEFLKLLRHEAGHAICHAYRLMRTRKWRDLFGSPKEEYRPETARFRPYSKSFVRHLSNWYAQTHPEEDFAETFAVWLTPKYDWRKRYARWKALKKLEYVDRVMTFYASREPREKSQEKAFDVSTLRLTLRTYYRRKRKLYEEEYPEFYDPDLRRIFSDDEEHLRSEPASKFLRRYRKDFIPSISLWTGEKKININSMLQKLIDRSQELHLRLSQGESQTALQVSAFLATLITNYRHTGRYKKVK